MSVFVATVVTVLLSALFVEVLMPIISVILSIPLLEIGRRVRRFKLLAWFISRYVLWALEGVAVLSAGIVAHDIFQASLPFTLAVDTLCLFHVLVVLYLFDLQHFNGMTGVWHMTCSEDDR